MKLTTQFKIQWAINSKQTYKYYFECTSLFFQSSSNFQSTIKVYHNYTSTKSWALSKVTKKNGYFPENRYFCR